MYPSNLNRIMPAEGVASDMQNTCILMRSPLPSQGAIMTQISSPGLLLDEMRARAPLVQCITNFVAMNIAANVVLAAGGSPAMVHAAEESGEFAAISAAVTINIGTLSPLWLAGMRAAVNSANVNGKPWVLDPVAHFATSFRRDAVAELMDMRPAVVRGNASEIMALAGAASRGKGADSQDSVDEAQTAAVSLAARSRSVVAVTGASDFVTDGERSVRIEGGSPLMPRVTALGCSLTGVVGAFVAIAPQQAFEATVAALAMFAVAGEQAGKLADGPGSFEWRFIDALAALDGKTLDAEARIYSL